MNFSSRFSISLSIMFFVAGTLDAEDASVNLLLDRVSDVVQQQLDVTPYQNREVAVEVTLDTESQNQKLQQSQNHLLWFGDDAGLTASTSITSLPNARSSQIVTFVSLLNSEYAATIRNIENGKPKKPVSFGELPRNDYLLENYWRADDEAVARFQSVAMMTMTGMFFDLGNRQFPELLAEWKKSGGTVSKSQVKEGLIQLAFQGWPIGDDGKMTYRIDPETFAITEMEVSIDRNKINMVAEDFVELAGTRIPNQIRLKNLNFVGDEITKVTKWKFTKEDASMIGLNQTYLAHYGLGDPDLGVLPEKPTRWWFWVTISLCLVIATGLLWYFYQSYRLSRG